MTKRADIMAEQLQVDIRLVATFDVCGLIAAEPDEALTVARRVALEMPGGGQQVSVVDCDRLVDEDVAFLMERHLAPGGGEWRPGPALVLFREVHALSDANQTRLCHLCVNRPRYEAATRILASTSLDVRQLVTAPDFQPELLYLLNMVTLQPPSRQAPSEEVSDDLEFAPRRG